jgi:hypothetical protein
MGLSPSGFKKIMTTFDVHFRKVSGFKVIKLSSINFANKNTVFIGYSNSPVIRPLPPKTTTLMPYCMCTEIVKYKLFPSREVTPLIRPILFINITGE